MNPKSPKPAVDTAIRKALFGVLASCSVLASCVTGNVAAGQRAAEPALRAGAARAKITPDAPVMLAGYGSRNQLSEGVAADLWARALALDDGTGEIKVLVTADIIAFGPVISRAIKAEAKRRYGLAEERLLLVGSHTHSGPVISERTLVDHPEQVRERDPYREGLQATIVRLIGEAIDARAPATLAVARGEARFAMYRRVKRPDGTWGFGDEPQGPTDPDVPVMAVRSPDGALRAIFFTYACHCTSVRHGKDGFYRIHPDWAIACAKLEEKLPGVQVMFVTGCGGDLDPGPKGALAEAERNGQSMLAALEAALAHDTWTSVAGPIRARLKRIDLPLEKPDVAAFERVAASDNARDQRFAAERLAAVRDGTVPTTVSYPLVTWQFGSGLTMVCFGGETCVEYALRIKRELGADRAWPIGYANEVMCYIPSERVLRENGYESGWSLSWGRGIATSQMAWSGWPTPFALGLEDRIIAAVHELVENMPPAAKTGAFAPPPKMRLRVAGAQLPVTRDVRANVASITRAIEFARREQADVLVTPEGSLSGYWAGFDAEATRQALEEVVTKARVAKVALVLGTCFAEADGRRYDGQRFYNRDGELLGFHSKILLCRRVADPAAKGEIDFFQSSPLRTFTLQGLRVGGLVCNDMWANPEWTPMPDPYLARQLAGLGARVIFLSVNAGQDEGEALALNRSFHESNLRLRARSAGLWVVVADAADPDGKKPSNCPSGVLGPDGRWAVQVEPKGEQFFAHTIELEQPH